MFRNNYNFNYDNNPYMYNNMYNPTPMQNSVVPSSIPATPSTNTNKIFVNGIDDVRSRILPPNSDYTFLDNDKPILYQKVVDAKGQFEVKVFDIVPHKDTPVETPTVDLSKYVLRTDFENVLIELTAIKEQLNKLGGSNVESFEK